MIAVLLAICSAFCNAADLVLQHVVSRAAPAQRDKGWRLALHLVQQPMWILGAVAMMAAFVLHAFALHFGQLSLVQPVLVTELIFTLLLRRVYFHQPVGRGAWGSAVLTMGALVVFLLAAEPTDGTVTPSGSNWVAAIVVFAVAASLVTVWSRAGSPGRRAALLGLAAGLVWALDAAFVKTTTDVLAAVGFWQMFLHWPVYGLIASGIIGTLLVQAALHTGPLASSQPLIVITDPFASIALGVWLFSERFTEHPLKIAVAAVSFAAIVAGVVLMSMTTPSEIVSADTAPSGRSELAG